MPNKRVLYVKNYQGIEHQRISQTTFSFCKNLTQFFMLVTNGAKFITQSENEHISTVLGSNSKLKRPS
jgi:hypothetical protein